MIDARFPYSTTEEALMTFLGIDLPTNCSIDSKAGTKKIQSFKLDSCGLSAFYKTLNRRTYVLAEAIINTFAFVELFQHLVAAVLIANTFKLKLISVTDKVDAEKLARILKMQVISGKQQVSPVLIPPKVVQDLRALFSTYTLIRKQITATKNRIHSLLRQNLSLATSRNRRVGRR